MKPEPASLAYPAGGRGPVDAVISGEVVAAVAAHAAAGTPGVTRLEPSIGALLAGLGRGARLRLAGIEAAPVTGAAVRSAAGQVSIRLFVAVAARRQAARTAAAVQHAVRRAVTAATGLPVAAVHVAVLDISRDGAAPGPPPGSPPPGGPVPGGPVPGLDKHPGPSGMTGPGGLPAPAAGGSRIEAGTAILAAVRSVAGLQPATPIRLDRARGLRWDPALLAVSLTEARVEVQLAATRLPLPPLLDQAGAAVGDAIAPTRWAGQPLRLVVTALDSAALTARR